jgi:asparagine synthase (glutamine-hydrolysing)
MSAQFGRWNIEAGQIDSCDLETISGLLTACAPDAASRFSADGLTVLYRAFHTTRESHSESQPIVCRSGTVLTWDGRLDNRSELLASLSMAPGDQVSDASIAAAAFERWGARCFPRFLGDWAIAVGDPREQIVILARDFVGARPLYYCFDRKQITWSSLLEPLLLLQKKPVEICEEYLAGWLGSFPAVHLTPYRSIHSVPPSSLVTFHNGDCRIEKYWSFDPSRKIRCKSDREYEEQFRCVFRNAVRRRLRSDRTIVAELSGGMDSSAIVCVADQILAEEQLQAPGVETLSYFDDSEPNWNERPYFAKVEQKRGREGCHIDLTSLHNFRFHFDDNEPLSAPLSVLRNPERIRKFKACLESHSARVVLSGFGGDEVTGGVPTPFPELEDLVARAHFVELSHKLKQWALATRKPWAHLLARTLRAFLPSCLLASSSHSRPPVWLDPQFAKQNRKALLLSESRLKLLGSVPSFQDNLATLEGLRRQLSCMSSNSSALHEVRYPYLDRDFLEFLYAIPREQLVRPGRRRCLMRRALVGIVPTEILERKRKAFVS